MHNEHATLAVDCVHIGITKTMYIDVGDFLTNVNARCYCDYFRDCAIPIIKLNLHSCVSDTLQRYNTYGGNITHSVFIDCY